MLGEQVRRRMIEAMKAGRGVEKEILKLALGEIQTAEARGTKALDDEQVAGILRKLIKSNRESLEASRDAAQCARLEEEIAVLDGLLPKTLGVEEIVAALEDVREQVLGAGSDGQATGVAMKHLRAAGASVQGRDVSQAVRAMRG